MSKSPGCIHILPDYFYQRSLRWSGPSSLPGNVQPSARTCWRLMILRRHLGGNSIDKKIAQKSAQKIAQIWAQKTFKILQEIWVLRPFLEGIFGAIFGAIFGRFFGRFFLSIELPPRIGKLIENDMTLSIKNPWRTI